MAKKKQEQVDKKIDVKARRKKIIKIVILSLVIVITLGVVALIILNILITDKNRNTFEDKGLTNQQIIDKEFVEGLSQMNDNFEFKLEKADINQLLSNSLKAEEVSQYVESAYLDIEENNFKWCFDLKVPVFTTRLLINSHINQNTFVVDSMTMGKLDAWSMLQSGGYINDEMITKLFKNASLPIESDLSHGVFTYNPLKFIDMFSLGEVTSELFTLVNSSERLSVETDSIGFKLNLEGICVPSPTEITGSYDLPSELEALVSTNTVYNSLLNNEETAILEVSEENFSKWVKDCYDKEKEIEKIEGELINTKIVANIKHLEVKFTNNEFVVVWTLKLGNIYLEVSESLGLGRDEDGFVLTFTRPDNESQLQMILMDDFISKISNMGYASYTETNRNFELDFSNINMSVTVDIGTAKRLNIINNELTFFLERLL